LAASARHWSLIGISVAEHGCVGPEHGGRGKHGVAGSVVDETLVGPNRDVACCADDKWIDRVQRRRLVHDAERPGRSLARGTDLTAAVLKARTLVIGIKGSCVN